MKNFKKAVSVIVTFSLVLSGLSGCGKGSGNLVGRDGTAVGTAYQARSEDIKTEDLQRRDDEEYGQMRLYDLRQGIAASNAQTNSKDGQLQAKHFQVVSSTTDNLRIGDIGDGAGLVDTNLNGGAVQREKALPAGKDKDKDLRVKLQLVKGLKSVRLWEGLKINDKSLSFHGQIPANQIQIPDIAIHVAITGEEGAAYINAAKKAEEKRKPAVQCSMVTDDSRFWLFDPGWEKRLVTDDGKAWLRDKESGGIWIIHKQGVVWALSTIDGLKWYNNGPDGRHLADIMANERKVENPNAPKDWHWGISDDKDRNSILFGREGWLWLLLLSEEERKEFIEKTTEGKALSETLNWQSFNRALEEDKGETRKKLLAMKQPCHAEEEKANQWLDSPKGRYLMGVELLLIKWLGMAQGKLYQKAYSEKIEIFKSSPFAAELKKWEKTPEAGDWIGRQMRTRKCDGKTFQKDGTTVITEEECLKMHPESSGIEWLAEQDTQYWEGWLADSKRGGEKGFFTQNITEHLKELQKDYGLIFVRTAVWLKLINSETGSYFLIPKEPELGKPEYEEKNQKYKETVEVSKKFMESEAWFEFLISLNGLEFLGSDMGIDFWRSDNGYHFLNSSNGLRFLVSENGQKVLNSKKTWQKFWETRAWLMFLESEKGLEFLKSSKGLEFLKSSNGFEFLNSENGKKYKKKSIWQKFWKTVKGKEYKKWLYSNDYSCNMQTAGEAQTSASMLTLLGLGIGTVTTVLAKGIALLRNNVVATANANAATLNALEAVNWIDALTNAINAAGLAGPGAAVVVVGAAPVVAPAVPAPIMAATVAARAAAVQQIANGLAMVAPNAAARNAFAVAANNAAGVANGAAANAVVAANALGIAPPLVVAAPAVVANGNALVAVANANAAMAQLIALSKKTLALSAVASVLTAVIAAEAAKAAGAGWHATMAATLGGGIVGGAGVLAVAVGLTTPLGLGLAVTGVAGFVVSAITILGAKMEWW